MRKRICKCSHCSSSLSREFEEHFRSRIGLFQNSKLSRSELIWIDAKEADAVVWPNPISSFWIDGSKLVQNSLSVSFHHKMGHPIPLLCLLDLFLIWVFLHTWVGNFLLILGIFAFWRSFANFRPFCLFKVFSNNCTLF